MCSVFNHSTIRKNLIYYLISKIVMTTKMISIVTTLLLSVIVLGTIGFVSTPIPAEAAQAGNQTNSTNTGNVTGTATNSSSSNSGASPGSVPSSSSSSQSPGY